MEEIAQEMPGAFLPSRGEKKWFRNQYNWAGATLLLQIAVMNIIAIVVMLIAMTVQAAGSGMTFTEIMALFQDPANLAFLTILANVAAGLIGYPIVYLIGCRGLKVRPGSFFKVQNSNAKLVAFGICLIMGVQVVAGWAAVLITELGAQLGFEFTTFEFDYQDGMVTSILTLVMTCVVAPIFEELIFRGLILKACSQSSPRFGILMSAFLFALFHQNLPQMFFAFPLGLVLGLVAYKAGSILPAILMHFAVNFSSMVQQAIFTYYPDAYPAAGGAMTVVFLIAGLAAVVLGRKQLALPKTSWETKKRTAPLFWSSWAIWLAVVVCLVFTLISIQIL